MTKEGRDNLYVASAFFSNVRLSLLPILLKAHLLIEQR